jgi:hypothetical protein
MPLLGSTPAQDAASTADGALPWPPGTNLVLDLTGDGNGQVVVFVMPHKTLGSGRRNGSTPMEMTVLHDGAVDGFPLTLPLSVPPGNWVFGALLHAVGAPLESIVALALHCKDGAALPLPVAQPGQPPPTLALHLMPAASGDMGIDQCGTTKRLVEAVTGFAVVHETVSPPPTKEGAPHLLHSVVVGERLWLAGQQDGFVHFEFPGGKPADKLAGWQVHGKVTCSRIARAGPRLFCSARGPYLEVATLSETSVAPAKIDHVELPSSYRSEGLSARGDWVYVAAHDKDLIAVSAAPPHEVKQIVLPKSAVQQAWDVAPLGPSHLALADGSFGLTVLELKASVPQPVPTAKLALPGVSAYLHTDGTRVIVGALGGGMHVVEAADPKAPVLLGTITAPGPVYGVTVHEGVAIGAAGHQILFAQLPKPFSAAPPVLLDAEPAWDYALDVKSMGTSLLISEFQDIRRITLDFGAAAGPLFVPPKALFARAAAVGSPIPVQVRLVNRGPQPLQVKSVKWVEDNKAYAPQPLGGPYTVPATGEVVVAFAPIKTKKGITLHEVEFATDDPSRPAWTVQLVETTDLQPGDTLPKLEYQDATGKAWNVAQHFKGKLGVLLVAAHSCPIAFTALASARDDLAVWLKAGQLAAVAINPWDTPSVPATQVFDPGFPVLFSPLTTSDGHDWSEVIDVTLGQPENAGTPMPIVYIVGKDGVIVYCQLGYEPARVKQVIAQLLGQ